MWSCLLILVALCPLRTDAEGSASLFPSSGVCNSVYLGGSCRANIEWRSDAYGPVSTSVKRRTLFYVHANQGEVLFMGSTARNAPGLGSDLSDILVYEPGRVTGNKGSETIPSTADLSCRAAQPSTGRIASRAEELAGPTVVGGPSGYNPCVYTAPVTGVYNVIMYGPAGDGNQTNGEVSGDIALGSGVDQSQGTTIAGWDISVRASLTSTTPINGRVFTYAIAAFTGTNDRPVYMTYYVVILDGYRYKVETYGMDPNGWMMYGNQLGFMQPDGTPLYHDVRGNNGQLNVLQGGVRFALPQFPLFFSPPDDTTLTLLNIPITPTVAVISDLSFSGTATGNTALYKLGGTFSFESNVDAVYEIILNAGPDSDPTLPTNRVLRGHTPAGPFSVVWDGKDNSGNFFPVGGYEVKASIHGGEYHFPFIDVENNVRGGPFITLLNGPCPNFNGGCTGAFFDDRGYRTTTGQVIGVVNGPLCPSQPGSASNSVLGFDTTSGDRAFGDRTGNANVDCLGSFGDAKGLDLWTYTPSLSVDTPIYVIDHGISGIVFADSDNNGVQDAGEYGLAGYVVEITDNTGQVWTTVTDASGQYGIHLPIGTGFMVMVIDSLDGVLSTQNNPQGPFDVVASTVETASPVGFYYQGTLSPTAAGPPVIAGSPPSTTFTGQPYYYQFYTTQGGPAPHFAFTNVPSWMTVNTITGEVSGVPNAIATYTIGVTAFNVYGSSSLTYTLVVDGFAPTIIGSPSLTGYFGTPYSANFAIDGFPYPSVEVFGPSWMSISPTGEISGTPNALSSSLIEVRASNSYGNASHFYTLDVVGSGGAVSGNPPPAVVNTPYSYQLMVAGYPAPNLTMVGPAWLNISSTGLITGTPDAPGTFDVVVTAANSMGTSQQHFTLVVNGAPPQITNAPPTYSAVNEQYTYYAYSSGVPAPTYSMTGPSWASIDPTTGFLSGTPTQMGVYTFTVTATNEYGSDSVQYTLTIGTPSPTAGPPSAPTPVPLAAPHFTSTPVTTAFIGVPYSYPLAATGNPVPSFTIVSGPAWLSLNGNVIQGTPQPSDDGSIVMIVRADNGISPYDLQTYRLDVASVAPTPVQAPIITSTPPTNIEIGKPFSYDITYIGQDPVFILAGSLPDWLNLQGCCTLVGTPTQLGLTSPIVLTASNGYQPNDVQTFQLNVVPVTTVPPSSAPTRPPTPLPTAVTAPVITSIPETSATINGPYVYYITASGYPTPVITTSDLPPWLHFNGQVLSGTPTAGTAGSVVIAVKASNGVEPNATQVFTLHVQNPPSPPAIVSTAPLSATVGSLYTYPVLTTGSPTPNLTFTGPSFLTLAMNGGVLSLVGTPSSGTYGVTVTATNGNGAPAVQTYSLVVSAATPAPTQAPTAPLAPPVITSFPDNVATSAGPYVYNITSTGSPAPQYSLVGAPTWLTLSGSTLSGTPPSSLTGTITFRVVADNGVSPASSQLVTIQVNPTTFTAPVITSTPPTSVWSGGLYSYVVSATGFPSPVYLWTLPDWLTMSSNNVITGRPPFPGTYTISVRASNGLAPDAVQTYALTVLQTTSAPTPVGTAPTPAGNANAPQIVSTPPATALTGMTFVYNVTMTGNPAPILSVSGLPSWLSQIGCCTISGTVPSVITGSMIIGLTATNGISPPATQTAQIFFADPPAPRITSFPPTSAQATQPYRYVITTTGSPAPTLTTDPLPSWLTLANNTLQGTPPPGTTGTVAISITASNGAGPDAQQNFTIGVLNSNFPPAITSSPVVTGTAGSPYSYTAVATGNPAPTFTVSGAPSWMQVNGNQLSGTPTGGGSYPITVVASNGVGSSATQSFTLTVLVPPRIGPGSISPQNVPAGTVYNVQYPVTGNPVPTLLLSNNPSWLSLTDNVVSGTVPQSALGETVCYTLTAKNTAGSDSQLKCFDVIPANMETCQNGLQRLRGEMDYVARVSTATCPNAPVNKSFVSACHQGCDAPVVVVTDLILNNGLAGRRLLAAINSTDERAIALAAATTWGLPANSVYTLGSEPINATHTRVRVLAVTPSNNYALPPVTSADGYPVAQSSSSSAAQTDMLDLLALLMQSSSAGSQSANRIVYVDAPTPWWVYFLLVVLIISFVCWVLFCCGLLRSRERQARKMAAEGPSAQADGREGAYHELDQEKSAERIRLQRQLQELLAQKRRTLAEITALQAEMQRDQDNRLADHDQLEQEKEVSRLLKQMVELEATQQKQHASQIADLQAEIASLKRNVGDQRSGLDTDSSAVQDQIRELGSAYQDLKREQELQKQMQIKEQKKLLDTVENLSRALEKSRSEGEGLRERLDRERREREDLEHAIALDRAKQERERADRAREREAERDRLDRAEREYLENERVRLQEQEAAVRREKQRQPAPQVLSNFNFSDDSGLDDESGGSGDESQALHFPRGPGLDEDDIDMAKFATMSHADKGVFEQWRAREAHAQAQKAKEKRKAARQLARRQARHIARREAKAARAAAAGVQ